MKNIPKQKQDWEKRFDELFEELSHCGRTEKDFGKNIIKDFIFSELQRLIEEVREIAEEMGECNCCKWDDNGFQHEPHCNSKKPIAYFEALDDLLNKLKEL